MTYFKKIEVQKKKDWKGEKKWQKDKRKIKTERT